MKYAYDLDGVIANESKFQAWAFRLNLHLGLFVRDHANLLYTPAHKGVIITGRPVSDVKRTTKWLRDREINLYVKYLPEFGQSVVQHKARQIRELDIDVFVESDDDQIEYLKKYTFASILSPLEGLQHKVLKTP